MATTPLKTLVPARLRRRLRDASGVPELRERLDRLERQLMHRIEQLETQLHESRDEVWERSRTRWRAAQPTTNLTWDAEITGDAFIEKAQQHGVFGAGRSVVEVGPGYGRLLTAALERGVEFGSYTGVDISARNVEHLSGRFDRPDVRFVEGDVEKIELDAPIDAVISSLVFKHLFPSFEAGLTNLARQMNPGGIACFDLIEGHRRYFEDDGVTYIRWYERPEIEEILGRAGLELVTFDEVWHVPHLSRLLVVARRP